MDSRMNAWTWGLLVLLGLIWGGSFFFARIAVQHVPPLLDLRRVDGFWHGTRYWLKLFFAADEHGSTRI